MVTLNKYYSTEKNRLVPSKKNKSEYIYNVPCAFDIETTSFYNRKGEKQAVMYHWQFMYGVEECYVTGRDWNSFLQLLKKLQNNLRLNKHRKLIIYVHNLGYEFQFMRKWLKISRAFFIAERKPLFFECEYNIIFKDTLILSGKKLASVGEELGYNKGDLDYSIIRNSDTILVESEQGYCYKDVVIVCKYIAKQIEHYGNIANIPLTNTGKVREYCRKKLLNKDKECMYYPLIKKATPTAEQFELLYKAFQGGYCHANYIWCDLLLEKVGSYDFTSSYPYVMISEKFPTAFYPMKISNIQQFNKMLSNFACVFEVTFKNLRAKTTHHILSRHKCVITGNYSTDNGRIIKVNGYLQTYMTDVDYKTFVQFYEYDNIKISRFYFSEYEYLPSEFIKCIIEFYKKKTTLKNVAGKEEEYQLFKGMLNSLYGMCVTNPCKPMIELCDNEYIERPVDLEKQLKKLRNKKDNFLLFQWGVWITAYARRNLLNDVIEINTDVIYCDTDSIKLFNPDKHKNVFDTYNTNVLKKLATRAKSLNISVTEFSPVDIKGIPHTIGLWDFEGVYDKFKTLGAKRYMTENNNKISITVAGLPKSSSKFFDTLDKPFDYFTDNMTITNTQMGTNAKKCLTYSDTECSGYLTDYQGHTVKYYEKSFIHMEDIDFNMNLIDDFLLLISGNSLSPTYQKIIDVNIDKRLKINTII